jgi:hypothetical protein
MAATELASTGVCSSEPGAGMATVKAAVEKAILSRRLGGVSRLLGGVSDARMGLDAVRVFIP